MKLLIKKIILDLKIYRKLHGVYPKRYAGIAAVRSILSKVNEEKVQKGVVIEENVVLNDFDSLGRYVYIGKNTIVTNCKKIGPFTSISHNVLIGLEEHPKDFISTSPALYKKRRGLIDRNIELDPEEGIEVGPDVLISSNVLVKNGVKLGVGCIIGAGAFVNKDVPPYAIVVGVPAKIIGYRFEEDLIEKLVNSKWWLKDDALLARNSDQIQSPQTFIDNLIKS